MTLFEHHSHPRQAFAMVPRRADARRRLAPESGTTDETVSDPLGLMTGTDLKWFRNQGLILSAKTCDITNPKRQASGVAICYKSEHLTSSKFL